MSDTGQLSGSAAEIYDRFFLPALFAEWPPHLVAAARLGPGMRVLDVACGTGVLTLAAAAAVAPDGEALGLDLNPGMLAVARRKAPNLAWLEGPAEELPFGDAELDAVVSQFGLMFFRDRAAAVREMWRVLRPGGRLAVAVWDALENVPGYAAVTRLLHRLFGDEVADRLRAPYALGDPQRLERLFQEAGVDQVRVDRVASRARFPSVRSWMHTDVRGWTLADLLDDGQFEELVGAAEVELERFVQADGTVGFEHPGLLVCARKQRMAR